MVLDPAKRKHLRAIGHHLNPVVLVANKGLGKSVIEETLRALNDHELIKVKFAVSDREVRQKLVDELVKNTESNLVQSIGKVILLFKPGDKPKHSNLLRVKPD